MCHKSPVDTVDGRYAAQPCQNHGMFTIYQLVQDFAGPSTVSQMIRLGSLNELVRRRWLSPSRKHEAVPWPGCGDGGWIGSTKVGHPRYKLIENNAIIDVCIVMYLHYLP